MLSCKCFQNSLSTKYNRSSLPKSFILKVFVFEYFLKFNMFLLYLQHNCHSAATCPPCMAFTTIYCHGKHEQRKTIPCSQGEFSCGLKCNRPLRCGQHKCIKICHSGACESEKDVCKQQCTKPRHMCAHMCGAPCHAGSCPDTACRENVDVLCQCGNRKQIRTCQDFSTGNSISLNELRSPFLKLLHIR